MSRRHHGGRSHRQNGHARGQSPAPTQASPRHGQPGPHPPQARPPQATQDGAPLHAAPESPAAPIADPAPSPETAATLANPHLASAVPPPAASRPPDAERVPHLGPAGAPVNGHDGPGQNAPSATTSPPSGPAPSAGCTAPQLRRFIKSRPYVPMHELRRRFGINGAEDDVTVIELDGSHVYVGLPQREGGLLGELLRGGEVGYELSLDPRSPVVVGLYPMRPVPRT